MWESRSLRFPRAVGARGKPGFGFPRRPSGRHFHGSFRAYTVRVGLAVSASGFASPLTVSPSLAKTRVWGFGFENSNFPWRWSAVSSTSRWGYLPAYDRMASDRLDPRYFAGTGAGRFLTVDPAESGSNWYAYVEGDPINKNDPSGLVSCADMVLDAVDRTLGQLLTVDTDEGLLGLTIFNESKPATLAWVTSSNFYRQQDAIASSIWNRYLILNGRIQIAGVSTSNVGVLGWGPAGASIRQVLTQSRQYDVIRGNAEFPALSQRAQETVNSTLSQEQSNGSISFTYNGAVVRMTPGCYSLWQSYVTSLQTFAGLTVDPFAASGVITTSFNSDPGNITVGGIEQRVGTIGGNTFFGVRERTRIAGATPNAAELGAGQGADVGIGHGGVGVFR